MRSALKFLLPATVASLTLAACGSSSSTSSSTPAATPPATSEPAATVKSASNAALGGAVLVDAQGLTLYHLSGEQNGHFICASSACTQVWHPLSASSGTPTGKVGSLGTVKRPDGTEQVTYKGTPLYTFTQDHAAGEANGQGVKDVGTWSAIKVGAAGATESAPAATPAETSPPSSSGGGSKYGY
jgi:predicted lipoprotein with Yx(FWY)xxD motif